MNLPFWTRSASRSSPKPSGRLPAIASRMSRQSHPVSNVQLPHQCQGSSSDEGRPQNPPLVLSRCSQETQTPFCQFTGTDERPRRPNGEGAISLSKSIAYIFPYVWEGSRCPASNHSTVSSAGTWAIRSPASPWPNQSWRAPTASYCAAERISTSIDIRLRQPF